jgi:hypothetical protein
MALDLFSHAEEAARRRDVGIARAAHAQDIKRPGWSELAYQAIVALARTQAEVHVDDVLRVFVLRPDHPNAWGAVWQRAIRNGVIKHSGRVRPCKVDSGKHLHQSPIYDSLIYGRV